MARPLRIEYKGGFYHVTARGNARAPVFLDDRDFRAFLGLLEKHATRFNIKVMCYVLMSNHYHIMVETPEANLCVFMHNLQSHYANQFNRRHGRCGHLFQGRYKAIIVDKDSYLVELSRYIHLNPVRAGMAEQPEQWEWSSYRACVRPSAPGLEWLERDEILKRFGKRRAAARAAYRDFVLAGIGKELANPLAAARSQLILGSEEFDREVGALIEKEREEIDTDIVSGLQVTRWTPEKAEQCIRMTAAAFSCAPGDILNRKCYGNCAREAAIYLFHKHSRWRVKDIGVYFGVVGQSVGRTVRRFEARLGKDAELSKKTKQFTSTISA